MDIVTLALSKQYTNKNRLTQANSYADLPAQGQVGSLYLTKDTGQTYYWDENTETYVTIGTAGRTGTYSTTVNLPTTIGQSIEINKTDLSVLVAPTVPYSEGSEVVGANATHGLIVENLTNSVQVKTIMDATIDSFKQVATIDDLPLIGQENVLYAIKDIQEFRAWSLEDGAYYTLPTVCLNRDLTVKCEQGNYKVGDFIAEGTSLETIIINMLLKTNYPTFTNPSASLSATGAKLLECGSTLNTTFTITFNRGSITPAYGTSGKRAGAATGYSLNGGATQSGNTFSQTISESNMGPFTGTVYYAEGEQPLDDNGDAYDQPYPAGSINTGQVKYEFVNALYANTANITTVAKLALVSKGARTNIFKFPAQTIANPECFEVPADWTISAVEMLNTLNNQWESVASEFTITNTTHQDAAGNTVNYKRYTDNRGYAAADRQVRITFS